MPLGPEIWEYPGKLNSVTSSTRMTGYHRVLRKSRIVVRARLARADAGKYKRGGQSVGCIGLQQGVPESETPERIRAIR